VIARGIAFLTALVVACSAPDVGDDRLDRAIALANEGRFAEARPLLEAHVKEQARDATALAWLAYAQVSLADGEAALATTQRALELAPRLGPLWYHRGRALLLAHDFAAADAAFARAGELEPDFFPRWRCHFQSLAALGLGDEARARQLYARSPEADEAWADPAFLFERMAMLYSIVPECEPARGWYRRAASEYFVGEHVAPPLDLPPPVRGEWLVSQGNFGDESHFGIAGSYSFDLGLLREGRLFREPAADAPVAKTDSFTYDAPIEAPVDALVVRVVDGLADNAATLADPAPLADADVRLHPLGNHVVLKVGEDAFLLLAHLRAGTIEVKEGAGVTSGTRLGRVGQSGVSYAPHLHVSAWRSLDPPIGRPLRFTDARVRAPDGGVATGDALVPECGTVLIRR
jgi:hypothetical protein